jgi:hypothetical protein
MIEYTIPYNLKPYSDLVGVFPWQRIISIVETPEVLTEVTNEATNKLISRRIVSCLTWKIPVLRRVRITPPYPASHRKRRKRNPMPGGITGPPCLWRV